MAPSKNDSPSPPHDDATEIDPRLRAADLPLAKPGHGLLTPSGSIEIPIDFDSSTEVPIVESEEDLEEALILDAIDSSTDLDPEAPPAEDRDATDSSDRVAILSKERRRSRKSGAQLAKVELTPTARKDARPRDAATLRIRELERENKELRDAARRTGAPGASALASDAHPDLVKLNRYIADLFNTAQRAVKLDELSNNLKQRLDARNKDVHEANERIESLEDELADATELANQRLEQITALQAHADALQGRDTEVLDLQLRIEDAEHSLEAAVHAAAHAEAELTALSETLARTEATRDEAIAQRNDAFAQLDELSTQHEALAAERDQAIAERDHATAALNAAHAHSEVAELEHAALVAERNTLITQRDEAIAQRNDAFAQLDELSTQHEALAAERDQAFAEREEALALRDEAILRAEEAASQRAQALAERDEALAERDQTTTERDQVSTERDQALTERDRALAERDQVRALHLQTVTQRDEAIAEREARHRAANNLKAALDKLTAEHRTLNEKLATAQADLEEALHLASERAREAEHFETQANAVQLELDDLAELHRQTTRGHQDELQKLADRLDEANAQLAARAQSADAQLEEITTHRDELLARVAELEAEVDHRTRQKDAELGALSKALEKVVAERNRLKTRGEELIQKAEQIHGDAKAALQKAQLRVDQLEGELALQIDQLGQARDALAQRDEQIAQLDLTNEQLSSSLELLQQQQERNAAEAAHIEAERDSLARTQLELTRKLEPLQRKNAQFDEVLTRLRGQLDDKNLEAEHLRQQLNQAIGAGESLEYRLADVERRENEHVAELDALRADHHLETEHANLRDAYDKLQAEHHERGGQLLDAIQEAEQLRASLEHSEEQLEATRLELRRARRSTGENDSAEIDRLRTELETVRQRAARVETLIAENDKLRSQIRQTQTPPQPPPAPASPPPASPASTGSRPHDPVTLSPDRVPPDVEDEINQLLGVPPLTAADRQKARLASSGNASTAASNPTAQRDPMQRLRDRGLMTKRPVVDYTRTEGVDHRAGFLLTQVDGMVTVEDLIDLSGLNVRDAAQLVLDLFDSGALRA